MKIKSLFALTALFASGPVFAETSPCEKVASETALKVVHAVVADDCFVQFTKSRTKDPQLYFVGIRCDHTRSYLVQVQATAYLNSCITSKVVLKPIQPRQGLQN